MSRDGRTWRAWTSGSAAEQATRRLASPPVYARYLRLRAEPAFRDDRQPAVALTVDPDTGLVDSPPRRPRDAPDPRAEVRDWTGTLLGLTEVEVRSPVAPDDDAALFHDVRPGLSRELYGTALLLAVALALLAVLRRPAVAPAGPPAPAAPTAPWGPGYPPGPYPRPPRDLPALLLRLASVAAGLSAAVAALELTLFVGVLVPILGLLFVAGLGGLAPLGLATALAALVLLLAAGAAGGARRARATAVLLVGSAVVHALALALFLAVDESEGPVDPDRTAAVARPLPVSADPLRVVRTASVLAASDDRTRQVQACALLAPGVRAACRPDRVDEVEPGELRYVLELPDRAVVAYDETFGETEAVRLVRSRRGWELLELPDSRASCVDRRLRSGEDPFGCARPRR